VSEALTCTPRGRDPDDRKSSPTDRDRIRVDRRAYPPPPAIDSANWAPGDPRPTCYVISADRGTHRSSSVIDAGVAEQRGATVLVPRSPLQLSVAASGHATR